MATEPVIQIEGLTVRYGSFVAVDDLRLEIRKGEMFGLLGPNGAGKSSTIKVLIGQRQQRIRVRARRRARLVGNQAEIRVCARSRESLRRVHGPAKLTDLCRTLRGAR